MSEAVFFDIVSPTPPPPVGEDLNLFAILAGTLVTLVLFASAYRWVKSRPLRRAKKRLTEIRVAYQKSQLDSRLAAYLIAFELRQVLHARRLNPVASQNKVWLTLQAALADLRYPRVTAQAQHLEEIFKLSFHWLKRPRC